MKRTQRRMPAPAQQQGTLVRQRPQSLVVPANEYYNQAPPEDIDDGQDQMIHPPMWLFILGGLEILWGGASNIFQVVTSFTGILGWQQRELIDAYGYAKAMELSLNRNFGLIIVATVLSIGAQIGIQVFTQQISRTWKEKRVLEHESTKQALIEIVSGISIGQLYGYASILICVWSDYMYITQIDSTGSLGSYILMTFWALILGCSSTYVFTDGIQRFWSGVLALRAWALWQDALKAHFEELARQYQQP